MTILHPLPNFLIERFRGWRANRYEESRSWYARLAAEGQRPRTMVISCCDSRVEPAALFTAEPGDLFMVRNVASLVPPHQETDRHYHGTSAAIEYAVRALKVSHLLVIGHSQCGGVEACYNGCAGGGGLDESDYIGAWINMLLPAYQHVERMEDTDRETRLRAMEKRGVVTSLDNLKTFPFVAEAVEAGNLRLHGAWFDIATGGLHGYDPARDDFVRLD